MIRLVSLCLVGSLLGGLGSQAYADRREEAHAAESRAETAFDKAQYEKALTEYQTSYAKSRKPYLLFRIGECYRMLGKPIDAVAAYRTYVAKVTRGADRKKAVEYIAELDIAPRPAPPPVVVYEPPPQSQDTEAPPLSAAQIAKTKHDEEERRRLGVSDAAILAKPSNEPLPPGYDPSSIVAPKGAAPPAHFYPAGYEKPVYRRWWPWTILGLGVAAGVGIGLGLAFGLPKFNSELPIGGPASHALTQSLAVRF